MGCPDEASPPAAGPLVHRAGQPGPAVSRGRPRSPWRTGPSLRVDGSLPADLPLGYHEVRPLDGRPARRLIVAPGRCHLPEGLRTWGWAIQLYALRSRGSWGMGDLADLRRLAEWSRDALEAGAVLLNPLHAVLPLVPQEASPYFPSSRRYRNPLYLRVEEVLRRDDAGAGAGAAGGAGAGRRRRAPDRSRRRVPGQDGGARGRVGARGARADPGWLATVRGRVAASRSSPRSARSPSATAPGGDAGPRSTGTPSLRRWRASPLEHAERVAFHAWLQWQLDEQLARAGRALRLVTDLAIGFDGEGADAWAWQDVLARDVTVGAPPDEFAARRTGLGPAAVRPASAARARLRAVRRDGPGRAPARGRAANRSRHGALPAVLGAQGRDGPGTARTSGTRATTSWRSSPSRASARARS